MIEMKQMGYFLSQRREYLKLSQEKVARTLRIPIEEVQEYERRHFIASNQLQPFLKLYKIKESDLFMDEEQFKKINTKQKSNFYIIIEKFIKKI